MKLYLRFSKDIEKDIENGNSYHYSDFTKKDFTTAEEVAEVLGIDVDDIEYNEEAERWCVVLPGLCAFELDAEDLEDAIEEAEEFEYHCGYSAKTNPNWHILEGRYVGDCPEGDCIRVKKLLYSNPN